MADMHARSTTIHGDPGSVGAATDFVRDEVMPEVRAMDGCVGLSMLADPASGRCIVTTSWRDEAAMRASREGVRASAQRTAEILGGEPELQEWEIAAMHRVLEARQAARSRVTWLRTAPDAVDRAVDAVRLSLMPKLDDLPGFCSVSIMVRRSEGLAVAAISYDSDDTFAQAGEGAREFRDEFAPAMGIEVVDSAEFDVPIAHLRVPETT
ncbi:putative quinol monooxygenase [Modestobacter versicolor]|uniref:Quinol monooxygenase YgiN n=2 Tax=Modestobacter versicolor TaxID=429133 RepID=A0A839Y0R9_9ACTN|nr:antibiotic biosynthesis monooxygenase [Modestobacter versicolor]MBB3674846.1 quinol monooxygenase YgiN [Modestobacter versicolor]